MWSSWQIYENFHSVFWSKFNQSFLDAREINIYGPAFRNAEFESYLAQNVIIIGYIPQMHHTEKHCQSTKLLGAYTWEVSMLILFTISLYLFSKLLKCQMTCTAITWCRYMSSLKGSRDLQFQVDPLLLYSKKFWILKRLYTRDVSFHSCWTPKATKYIPVKVDDLVEVCVRNEKKKRGKWSNSKTILDSDHENRNVTTSSKNERKARFAIEDIRLAIQDSHFSSSVQSSIDNINRLLHE